MSVRSVAGRDTATGQPIVIEIEGGHIARILPGDPGETHWLAPGLIDLQVNGFKGHDLNREGVTADLVVALTAALAATGVTSFAPTVITAAEERIVAALQAIAEARDRDPRVRHAVPYVHVEGPHISPEDGPRGAHPAACVRPPDLAEFDRWQAASGGLAGMVTLSPHWPGSVEYIKGLRARDVHVAIGHTHAMPEQVGAAAAAGARLSTHLGNGAHATLPRHPNFIWAQLAHDGLTASFIADGHHLPGDTLKAMIRAKGVERSILVSDAVALAGMPPGIYDTPIGGRVELSADGRLGVLGTPYLAGAAKGLAECVAGAVLLGELELGDAIRMATANPGRFMGGRGVMAEGAAADLIRFAWDGPHETTLRLESVLVAGQPLT